MTPCYLISLHILAIFSETFMFDATPKVCPGFEKETRLHVFSLKQRGSCVHQADSHQPPGTLTRKTRAALRLSLREKRGEYFRHKGIRYIEWYRDYLMTIRRQLFCGAAIVERIRTPSSPHLSFPTWTSTNRRRLRSNQRAGFDDVSLSTPGHMSA